MNCERRNWIALFAANFFGVFNDNFLKHCIVFVAVSWSLPSWLSQSQIISAVSMALVLPYLIFSPLAGRWAVKYSRKNIFRLFKLLELPIMVLASIAFYCQWIVVAIVSVLVMGILSCLYSPAKYSLIRDIGGEDRVSYGSGMLEAMAFLGVLTGTVAASIISDHYNFSIVSSIFMVVVLLGYGLVRVIRVNEVKVSITEYSSINPISFIRDNFRFSRRYKSINSCILGYSIFWLLAGVLQMNLIVHCKNVLLLSNTATGIITAIAAIGVISGCLFVGMISKKRVRTDFIFMGLLGIAVMSAFIIIFKPMTYIFALLIFGIAFFGGFIQVPCLAFIQKSDMGRKLGDIMAYLNLITFIFVLIGTIIFSVSNFVFNDNSEVIFGIIMTISFLTFLFFMLKCPHFWKFKQQ